MRLQSFLRSFLIFSMTITSLLASEPELLKSSDVNRVMKQILDQHLGQKEMTAPILQKAIKIYIDQFDPNRIYLTEEEVKPYFQMTGDQLANLTKEYKEDHINTFESLNKTIQGAITRARGIRQDLEQDRETFVKADLANPSKGPQKQEWQDADQKRLFAKNNQDLKNRWKEALVHYVKDETRHYGQKTVMSTLPETFMAFENRLRMHEDPYLFKDANGQPMSPAEQENVFTIHVLKALAGSLDAHTTFYDAAEAYDMRVRLEKSFEGVGIILEQEGHDVVVKQLIPGSPAEKSRLVLINDKLVSIDDWKTKGQAFDDVMDKLRGENGSTVSLMINRAGTEGDKTIQVKLKREPIVINDGRVDVAFQKFGDGILGMITLHAFYQGENGITSENDVRKALQELQSKGHLRGLILDLRDNSGGFLSQAVKVAGLFITNGVVVISKYSTGEEHFYRDMDNKVAYDGPLIILTSKATASAAEIVAQALQDYGVALVVGDEHTYGKGTIQSQTVTDQGGKASSYFKVTVGEYYTVSGKTPQIQGVKADVVVPGKYNFEKIGEEYLEYPVSQDRIAPAYDDKLTDIDANIRPWYLRYYTPTLQPRVQAWQAMVPTLKKNSEYRIKENKNYQMFLKQLSGDKSATAGDEEEDEFAHMGAPKNYGAEDLQMSEALNIVKDMVILQAKGRTDNIAAQTNVQPGMHQEAQK